MNWLIFPGHELFVRIVLDFVCEVLPADSEWAFRDHVDCGIELS